MKQYFLLPNSQAENPSKQYQLVYMSKVEGVDKNHPRMLHSHQSLVELILITAGSSKIFIGNQYFAVKKGDLIIYNSGVVHDELLSNDPIALYCIGIKGIHETNLRADALISDRTEPIFETGRYYDLLLPLFQSAFDILEQEINNYNQLVQTLGQTIIELLKANIINHQSKLTSASAKLIIVQEIKQYLDVHFAEEFKLSTLNQEGRWPINEYYFAHQFKALYDYTPIEYLQRRRIGEAQTLLINTDLSITEIAYQVGFNSSSYFTTLFKKIVHLSPRTYRNQYTER
ncbi:MAG: AraC family transcriptional regulator [Streptococcaceae bacterium]|jgi:AraC-like DNA-binding protein/mannose-6-phosphate isomerase-like protein (cupin superfamily)|nr:AraC family transcriptional regulator [Streptococcaceae bacterium]MCH4176138.1 AraC family transcriptional regulator [Streptococcaceae bacterium]